MTNLSFTSKKKIVGLLCVFSLLLGGCGGQTTSNSTGTAPAKSKTVVQKKEKTLQQKALEDKSVSTEYRNALKKAIEYVKLMHMSKKGVYKQLTSQYGEKFPDEAAQWAVDHLSDVDWKKEALAKAKEYQKQMSMSKQGVYDQLVSPYGEQFTEEEAQYAVDHLQ